VLYTGRAEARGSTVERDQLKALLARVQAGTLPVEEAVAELASPPFRQLPFATVDLHRHVQQGFPEVVLGEHKSVEQIASLVQELRQTGGNVLVTRVDPDKGQAVVAAVPGATHEAEARAVVLRQVPPRDEGRGRIVVVCAGTSDLPVAREAVLTAELMHQRVELVVDVGVAGIHRLMHHYDTLRGAEVVVVVAGMEGALASVVGGLVARPIIAVPTSVGYGAHFGGLAPLLGMLNACAAGVLVTNIDNGFGAGYAAALINRREPR
jgi:pyridinium-3,5-biscarboxylic acid mononucleotide synthase